MSEEQPQPVFTIEKTYVKDMSLEVPNAPQVFLQREQPQVEVQIHTSSQAIEEGYYETVVTVTVTAKISEDRTMFLAEAAQAGIFQIRHLPRGDLEPVLGITCPNILFPYAREVVSDMVTRAGFPPVILNPVNFEVLYQQQQAQQGQAGTTTH
jgi:preprotein translocase subunit SecB